MNFTAVFFFWLNFVWIFACDLKSRPSDWHNRLLLYNGFLWISDTLTLVLTSNLHWRPVELNDCPQHRGLQTFYHKFSWRDLFQRFLSLFSLLVCKKVRPEIRVQKKQMKCLVKETERKQSQRQASIDSLYLSLTEETSFSLILLTRLTFHNATTGFPVKWRLRNKFRN